MQSYSSLSISGGPDSNKMLEKLPDEILWNILSHIYDENDDEDHCVLEETLSVLPSVCRAWSEVFGSDNLNLRDRNSTASNKRCMFWMGLAQAILGRNGQSGRARKRQRHTRNAKETFFTRKRQIQQALRFEKDRLIWKLWRRLRKSDCVAWVRKQLQEQQPGNRVTSKRKNHHDKINHTILHHQVRDLEHRTLFHLVCWCGRIRTARMLLEQAKEQIYVLDDVNASPLLIASWAGHVDIVRLILATASEGDSNNNNKSIQLQKYLDQKGAPPLTSSCGGRGPKTGICWAERKEFHDVVRLLERAGANTDHRRGHENKTMAESCRETNKQ